MNQDIVSNNFYNNTQTYQLPLNQVYVDGEILDPGFVVFSSLPVRSLIVKEALPDSRGDNRFTGAFRYDGYSLFDILEKRVVKKNNEKEFSSVIDLYIEVESNSGEKALFSWGEVFYPADLHKIILAVSVSRIVPTKTGDLWDLPEKNKIVSSCDLLTVRNIYNPVRISVRSIPLSFKVVRGMTPMFSERISFVNRGCTTGVIDDFPEDASPLTYNTIFYGRGRGIHSTTPFTGVMLRSILSGSFAITPSDLQSGILCISGKDGYRCALSISELFNRNDRQEFLLIRTGPDSDGGLFRLFPSADFFSDRAVKSITGIHQGF